MFIFIVFPSPFALSFRNSLNLAFHVSPPSPFNDYLGFTPLCLLTLPIYLLPLILDFHDPTPSIIPSKHCADDLNYTHPHADSVSAYLHGLHALSACVCASTTARGGAGAGGAEQGTYVRGHTEDEVYEGCAQWSVNIIFVGEGVCSVRPDADVDADMS